MSPTERVCPVDVSVTERALPSAHGGHVPPEAEAHRGRAAPWTAIVVVAAAVAVDPWGMRPFTSLRWFLVSTIIAAGTLVTLTGGRSGAGRPRLPRWFVAAGAVVIGSMFVAAAVVGDPVTAWLGHPQRHLGVLAWTVFGAAALCGAASARSAVGHRRLAVAAVLAATATGVASVADLSGWSPLGVSFDGGRIGGLLGQPTTLGTFAVLLLPLAATAPVPARWRLVASAGLVVALLGSQTRGAAAGLVAAGVVSLPVLRASLRRRHLVGVLTAAVLVLATPAGDRLLSSPDSSRLDEWGLAMDVIAERPVLGAGPEGYRIAVVDALDDGYVDAHGRDVVIDRAHSAPLDVAASGGVLAGMAYVVLVGGVAVSTRRLQRRSPWSVPAAAGTGAVGFLVAGFFAFPVAEIDAVAWLFAGLAVAAAHPAAPGRPTPSTARRRSAALAAAVLVTVAVTAGASDVVADRWLAEASHHLGSRRIDDAVASADRATGLRPDLVDGWYVAATVAAAGPTILDLDRGIDRARAGLRRSPRDPVLRELHAELVAERYLRSGLESDRRAALDTLSALLDADPTSRDAAALRSAVSGS